MDAEVEVGAVGCTVLVLDVVVKTGRVEDVELTLLAEGVGAEVAFRLPVATLFRYQSTFQMSGIVLGIAGQRLVLKSAMRYRKDSLGRPSVCEKRREIPVDSING